MIPSWLCNGTDIAHSFNFTLNENSIRRFRLMDRIGVGATGSNFMLLHKKTKRKIQRKTHSFKRYMSILIWCFKILKKLNNLEIKILLKVYKIYKININYATGTVWAARCLRKGKVVAIKRMAFSSQPKKEMLLTEIKVMKQYQHKVHHNFDCASNTVWF